MEETNATSDILLSFLEKSTSGMIFIDKTHHVLWINDKACEILDYSKNELMSKNIRISDLGIVQSFNNQFSITNKDGKKSPKSTIFKTRQIPGKNYSLIIIEQFSFGQTTDTAEDQQKSVLNIASNEDHSVSIWSVDTELCYTSFSAVHKKLMKQTWGSDIKIGSNLPDQIPDKNYKQSVIKTYQNILNGTPHRSIDRFLSSSGHEIYRENFGNPVFDRNNRISGVMFYSIDITEKVKNEQNMLQTLEEKESLLREVHHRVKNNLQTISSILNLQMMMVDDDTTKRILQDSLARIKTMGSIHETLYQGDELNQISMIKYCGLLIDSFKNLYSSNEHNIDIENKIEDISLNVTQAIPVGLIMNELITNSMKYAFDKHQSGKITVTLRLAGNEYNLQVRDNGKGLPDDAEIQKSGSLGTKLVSVFVGQLGGRIDYLSEDGLKVDVYFPTSDQYTVEL